jgi:hypothetical protein
MAKNVKSQWVNGNLVFYNAAGLEIFRIDGANRRMSFPAPGTFSLPADAITSDTFVADATITAAKLANGAGLGALVAAGLGASANYDKTTDGAQDLAAVSASARACICVVVVTEVFADGTGTQPTFTIGDESTANSIMAVGKLTDAALGSVFVFAGQVTAAEKLVVTAAKATGDGTGAISVTALLLDES